MPVSQWCTLIVGFIGVVRCYIYIRRGASALLVSTGWANLRSLRSEASDRIGLHVFFVLYGYKESIAYLFLFFMDKEIMYVYETPQVEIIKVEVEKGFATTDGDANGEGSDMGWG